MTCLNQSNVFRQTNTSLRNWRFRMSNAQMCGAVLLVERASVARFGWSSAQMSGEAERR